MKRNRRRKGERRGTEEGKRETNPEREITIKEDSNRHRKKEKRKILKEREGHD